MHNYNCFNIPYFWGYLKKTYSSLQIPNTAPSVAVYQCLCSCQYGYALSHIKKHAFWKSRNDLKLSDTGLLCCISNQTFLAGRVNQPLLIHHYIVTHTQFGHFSHSYLLQLMMTSSGWILFFSMPCFGCSPLPRNRPGGSILKLPMRSLWWSSRQ